MSKEMVELSRLVDLIVVVLTGADCSSVLMDV